MDKGNCFKGVMNKSGWKEVTDKYCMFSGLRHTRDQFSSRMQQLRQEWAFCNKLRSGSGLGRLADGVRFMLLMIGGRKKPRYMSIIPHMLISTLE